MIAAASEKATGGSYCSDSKMEFAELIRTPKLDGVLLYEQLSREPIDGTLCITSHVLILSTRKEGAREAWVSMGMCPVNSICFTLLCISAAWRKKIRV